MGDSGDNLKKDFKNMFKHGKEAVRCFFRGKSGGFGRRPPGGIPPFIPFRSPWVIFFYPKIIVGCIILLTLLFCGVSLYGLIIIILLMIIFLLI